MKKANEEEHERRMQALNQRVRHDLSLTEAEWAAWRKWMLLASSSTSSAGKRRKRKKRKKKKLPRGGTRPRRSGHSSTSPSVLAVLFCVLVFCVVMDLGSWDDSRSRPCSASGCRRALGDTCFDSGYKFMLQFTEPSVSISHIFLCAWTSAPEVARARAVHTWILDIVSTRDLVYAATCRVSVRDGFRHILRFFAYAWLDSVYMIMR